MKKILMLTLGLLAATAISAQTQVIAHRGYHAKSGSYDNTISSLKNAQDLGIYGSECDVNETADGVLVVIHGPMHGKLNVQQNDYATVHAQALANGERIPTLDEYLEQTAKDKATKLIIEIKDHPTPQQETRVVKKTLAAVKKYKLQNQVEYIAFRQHVCDELVKYAPKGTKIAYLNGTLTPEYCKGLGYTGIDYNIGTMKKRPEWIKQCHDLGLTVNVWTVNDTEPAVVHRQRRRLHHNRQSCRGKTPARQITLRQTIHTQRRRPPVTGGDLRRVIYVCTYVSPNAAHCHTRGKYGNQAYGMLNLG